MSEKQIEKRINGCGFFGFYPKCLQKRANSRIFILVYGFLGLVQAMAFIYIAVTLTTLEKRFKIPSKVTGIILSGNEISQILSLILMYYGGAGNRPRWLAVGVGCSAISCFVLIIPHIIYGPGKAALSLTQEYLDLQENLTSKNQFLCPAEPHKLNECEESDLDDSSILPRILIFISQFVLGFGTTLYYGLGQTYLDDNTKKSNTPKLLGFTFALRTTGPAFGFILSFLCLKIYIVPSLHPVIHDDDPRWLGAWWLGWIILGSLLAIFSILIAMFPRHLIRKKKVIVQRTVKENEENDLLDKNQTIEIRKIRMSIDSKIQEQHYVPSIKDFRVTLIRLMSNKILMCNNASAIFGVLGFIPYFTFFARYLEVQFSISAAKGSVISGPITLLGVCIGFICSGLFISKFKPKPVKLLSWNVVVGLFAFIFQISYAFVRCENAPFDGINFSDMSMNFTQSCNENCNCDDVKYSPVCNEATSMTYFSACHAGCSTKIDSKTYGNCSCVLDSIVTLGPCLGNCMNKYVIFVILSTINNIFYSTGKIGNALVNYRCVETRDKSTAQGTTLMLISLFALIPGPIFYGYLIDQTCLIWDKPCDGTSGNCWYYDKDKFRYMFNLVGAGFTLLAAILDGGVCYFGRNLDIYGDLDEKKKRKEPIEETVNHIESN